MISFCYSGLLHWPSRGWGGDVFLYHAATDLLQFSFEYWDAFSSGLLLFPYASHIHSAELKRFFSRQLFILKNLNFFGEKLQK